MWRKAVSTSALVLFFLCGSVITFKELRIYKTAPDKPVEELQQLYPLHVMHGHVRYVTRQKEEDFVFWKEHVGSLVGIPLIVAFIALIIPRKRST